MAQTPPTTLVVFTEDSANFPLKYLYVVCKQLFQHHVRDVVMEADKVFVFLKYSPKATTLKKKFGGLPVRYMRTKLQNNEEFKILEKVIKKFKLNILDEEEDKAITSGAAAATNNRNPYLELPASSSSSTAKRKLAIEDIFTDSEDDELQGESVKKQKPASNDDIDNLLL